MRSTVASDFASTDAGRKRLAHDERAEPHAIDFARECAERHERFVATEPIARAAVLGEIQEQVIRQPDGIEAGCFGRARVLDDGRELERVLPGNRVVVLGQRESELHRRRG